MPITPPSMLSRSQRLRSRLTSLHPWTASPLIICAPMRIITGPQIAVTVSAAGGLGFLGPTATPDDILADLEQARNMLRESHVFQNRQLHSPTSSSALTSAAGGGNNTNDDPTDSYLPIGVGFQTWNGDLASATNAVRTFRPRAAWLFAPRHGQQELDEWTVSLRAVSPQTLIWIQVGTLQEATAAATSHSPPDVLVVQGAEAGGHGRFRDGMGTMCLFPEVFDALGRLPRSSGQAAADASDGSVTSACDIPLVAAGGVVDARGLAASWSLGASGVAMGTRFLATPQARIAKGYQAAILEGEDAGTSTVRTHLYNHLRGTYGWPEDFAPRTLINASWRDHVAAVGEPTEPADRRGDGSSKEKSAAEQRVFAELKTQHDEAVKKGDDAWGRESGRTATYVGAGVGMVNSVEDAGELVERMRSEVRDLWREMAKM